MIVEWIGRRWRIRELPPECAAAVSRLGSDDAAERLQACMGVMDAAGIPRAEVISALMGVGEDADILDLVGAVLRSGSARPWRTTVALCIATVSQWSMIRGRLIDKGIVDPLRDLPSLTALLDVVEVMILDAAKDDEEREKTLRELYRRDNATEPPPGWAEGVEGFDTMDFS